MASWLNNETARDLYNASVKAARDTVEAGDEPCPLTLASLYAEERIADLQAQVARLEGENEKLRFAGNAFADALDRYVESDKEEDRRKATLNLLFCQGRMRKALPPAPGEEGLKDD